MKKNILFISHKNRLCGVHEFGYQIGEALSKSKKYNFIYLEISSSNELEQLINKYMPICAIYNYHPTTMKWISKKTVYKYDFPQIGIIHEVTQSLADSIDDSLFNFYIAPDPTLILKNPIVYKTGRLLIPNNYEPQINDIPIIGSFGFATFNKEFVKLVEEVCKTFKNAQINLNIPFSEFIDKDGSRARKVIEESKKIILNFNNNITLNYSHEFLEDDELLKFLSSNTINVFMYSKDNEDRGISSVIDFALSVKVPIAISKDSSMFRHISDTDPSIIIEENNNLLNIIENGTKPLERFYSEWTPENIVWEYERIINDILKRFRGREKQPISKKIKLELKKILGKHSNLNSWGSVINNYKDNILSEKTEFKFEIVKESSKFKFNRILNNEAREIYSDTIKYLKLIIPEWMIRKIERANIQQAFVLDTVIRLIKENKESNILSVGCFEDTAYGALKKLGYNTEGVDPVLNYDLDTFITKPTTKLNYYDLVFSTSVIEHVEDDLTFIINMVKLTKIGGYIVLTCDFKEGYKDGDEKPSVDYRFYTREYIINNLISKINSCKLLDEPDWNCPNPDFEYQELDKNFNYTFASIVLKKIQ